jgi:hypothetical protein
VEVPDFRRRETRDAYRNDHWNPDPARRTASDPWPSVLGDIRPSEEGLAFAREVWESRGFVERQGAKAGAGLTR